MQSSVTPLLPSYSQRLEQKKRLQEALVGKPLDAIRTPAFVIDRSILERNCYKLQFIKQQYNVNVRVHVKTLKVQSPKKKIKLITL